MVVHGFEKCYKMLTISRKDTDFKQDEFPTILLLFFFLFSICFFVLPFFDRFVLFSRLCCLIEYTSLCAIIFWAVQSLSSSLLNRLSTLCDFISSIAFNGQVFI